MEGSLCAVTWVSKDHFVRADVSKRNNITQGGRGARQTGWIAALRRKPAEHALVGAMRLSHGCPSGRVAIICSGQWRSSRAN